MKLPGLLLLLPLALAGRSSAAAGKNHWIDVWTAMPQLTEPANLPNPPFNGSGVVFENATIRQTLQLTADAGSAVRLVISNAFGTTDLPITSATLARPANGSVGTSAVDPATLTPLTFAGGDANYTVPDGALVLSDPVVLRSSSLSSGNSNSSSSVLKAGDVLTVTLYLATGQASATNAVTSHPGSRTTSYMASGDLSLAPDVALAPGVQSVEHWYFISAVQAWVPASGPRGASGGFAIVGDSITDGRESTDNGDNRWTDVLAGRLQAAARNGSLPSVAVMNQAAGGNRVLYDGLGPNALGRVDRDILAQPGVRYAMVFEGVNDIGTLPDDEQDQDLVYTRLVGAYKQIIERVHAHGLPIFGATITPFTGPGQVYSGVHREYTRQRVNEWIRTSGRYDGVVDFDAVVRNDSQPDMLATRFNSGDWLHPNVAGYQAMGDAFNLTLFSEFADGVSSML
ncbi:SGNH hydrolase-type esterase domain-containing protein [Xylariaceae sp. FL0804]|nr:SGNH hydrolase-type esterase domain-containing protein [Xylariaceae sp. FL0804]